MIEQSPLYTAPRSLYVHVPFCQSKCFYCDFNSYVTNRAVRDQYVAHLVQELSMLHAKFIHADKRPRLDTIFFGGGTPTMLADEHFLEIADTLMRLFTITQDTEWTIEANPGTVHLDQLQLLRRLGVNRISFGAQTFNDTLLQAIGRLHSASDVLDSVKLAQQAGFSRINLDLMLGLPDQDMKDVSDALDVIRDVGITHVSAYGLKVEQGTPFAKWHAAGHLHLPDEDLQADMYDLVRNKLEQLGFLQYEISNFAQPGEEALHNLVYWRNLPYFAAGAGAHGYVQGMRYENERTLLAYGAAIDEGKRPVASTHRVDATEAQEDTMMLGLRLREGVPFDRFEILHGHSLMSRFGTVVQQLLKKGWLMTDGAKVWIPREYDPVANEIYAMFIE